MKTNLNSDCLGSVRGMNDSSDSILDEGDILEADIWRDMKNNSLRGEITRLLPR
jgi:hypothetical protein